MPGTLLLACLLAACLLDDQHVLWGLCTGQRLTNDELCTAVHRVPSRLAHGRLSSGSNAHENYHSHTQVELAGALRPAADSARWAGTCAGPAVQRAGWPVPPLDAAAAAQGPLQVQVGLID